MRISNKEINLLFNTLRNVALAASLLIVVKFIADNPKVTFNIEILKYLEMVMVCFFSGYLQFVNICAYFAETEYGIKAAKSKINYILGSAMLCLILVHLYLAIIFSKII